MGEIGKFIYPDLELSKAIGTIERIYNDFDGRITAGQLAKLWGIEPRGGGFANRVKDVVAYNLIEGKGLYTLTKLGTRIVQSQQDIEAKSEAFLHVPLFKAMFTEFKGKDLPENNEVFVSRLRELTDSRKESEVPPRAPRLRNHYNEALPYFNPEKTRVSESMRTSSHVGTGGFQQSGSPQVPSDYERLIGTDFVIGAKRDLGALDMLEAQVTPWIAALRKKLEAAKNTEQK